MIKGLERLGRRILAVLLGWLLRLRPEPVQLAATARILVVRLDTRLGNLVMTTPLLQSLRARFPQAPIDLLAAEPLAELLGDHPAVTRVIAYRRHGLLRARGPLAVVAGLRRSGYDLAIDAGNPTDPSLTQALIVRLSGARHTLGIAQAPFTHFYSAPAAPRLGAHHEIDLRLALLAPLPGDAVARLPTLPHLGAPAELPQGFTSPAELRALAVVNVGARLTPRHLTGEAYALMCGWLAEIGLRVVLTFGPADAHLAQQVAERCDPPPPTPPTTLRELAALVRAARLVVTADSGPMHLAVGLGTPTCAVFVASDPQRYGYPDPPHLLLHGGDGAQLRQAHPRFAAWAAGHAPG